MAVPRLSFLKDGDEHWRNILQTILGFRAVEKGRMLPEFIGHLVNDERATGPESVVCVLKQSAFLFDFENTERDASDAVVAPVGIEM